MDKKIVFIVGLLMTLVLIGNVLAITASIGNARMILRAEVGDKIEKSILVKNVNDVAVNIALTASGDLKDYITIKDVNFTLEPGSEKKAFFTIEVEKSGTTESKINVQFTPVGEKNGAGLSSSIMVIANGTSLDENIDDTNTADEETDINSSENSVSGSITGNIVVGGLNKNMIAVIITMITALIFIVVVIFYYTKFRKKPEESEDKSEVEEKKVVKTKPKKSVKKRE